MITIGCIKHSCGCDIVLARKGVVYAGGIGRLREVKHDGLLTGTAKGRTYNTVVPFISGGYLCSVDYDPSDPTKYILVAQSLDGDRPTVCIEWPDLPLSALSKVVVEDGIIIYNHHISFDGTKFVYTPVDGTKHEVVRSFIQEKFKKTKPGKPFAKILAYTGSEFLVEYGGKYYLGSPDNGTLLDGYPMVIID